MLEAGNLWELIERRAEATPDGQFAVDQTGRSMTFAEYAAACERAAAGLQELGVGEGSVVSWQLPTWIESMVLVGALSRLSALQNPILPILREREVEFIVRQARSPMPLISGVRPCSWIRSLEISRWRGAMPSAAPPSCTSFRHSCLPVPRS